MTSSSPEKTLAADVRSFPSAVSFLCQGCLQPLAIDASFGELDEHALAELKLPIVPAPKFSLTGAGGADLVVPGDFTLVGETGERATLDAKLKRTAELFELISDRGELDHPLCEECADSMLENMSQQLKLAESEAQDYQRHLAALDAETEDDGAAEALERELTELLEEEAKLGKELEELREAQRQADQELLDQTAVRDRLEEEELKYWKEYSKHKRELLEADDDYKSLECRLRYSQGRLEKLKKMNVFNATFSIWHSGHFATINGFRLGRLPSVPVDWNEINAAWGQTAFLMHSLAKAMDMESFARYQIVPYGNYSYIKVLSDGKVLPLYGAGGFRMIFDSKFDQAMVAFMDCLQQFAAEVERQGGFSLPYDVDKGKIQDNNTGQYFPVKLQFNSEDSWTKALRYMLTNLKWGLAYVSSKYSKQLESEDSSALGKKH